MQHRTVEFAQGVMHDLAYYLWTDPLIELPLVKRVAGTSIEIPVTFSAEDREGDFLDYNIQIEPFSMQDQSPGQRLQTITQVFSQFIAPFAPMMQAQGIQINFQGLLRTVAKYTNMTELDDLLTFYGPRPGGDEQPVGDPPSTKNPFSHRVYERVNRPGATRSGKDQALAQTLLGAGVQPAERDAMFRPTG